ncbi:MAG TPA: hypothetical protein VFN91_00940 [Myxococcaceae bacterium]|nr:hypothetical protein [Myxococcaceae bacterium]
MANPTMPDEESETTRRMPEDGDPSVPRKVPPPEDEQMQRSAESGEGEVPDDAPEQEQPEQDLPSNRAQERGGP